jgi:DNA-binding transcriptional ArsR family regulator
MREPIETSVHSRASQYVKRWRGSMRPKAVTGLCSHRIKTSGATIEALAALAQESRLAIIRHLFRAGADGLSAGVIARRLAIPAPTLSFHLSRLHHAGLVISRREGNSIVYAASYTGMSALLTYLTDDCCQGFPEIDAGAAGKPAVDTATFEPGDGSHEAPPRVPRR